MTMEEISKEIKVHNRRKKANGIKSSKYLLAPTLTFVGLIFVQSSKKTMPQEK